MNPSKLNVVAAKMQKTTKNAHEIQGIDSKIDAKI